MGALAPLTAEPPPLGLAPLTPRASGSARLGWAALAAVGIGPVIEAVRLLAGRPHVTLSGDLALLQLGALRAAHFGQLVGPYSREGFHHPGPAALYLLAPFAHALGPSGAGLYLGAVVLNGAALVAAVACVWRRHGAPAALGAAAAIDIWWVALGAGTLREPWNPYLVVAPMLLFVTLWAEGMAGSATAGTWAVAVGSAVLQTEIAAAGVVVVLLAALAGAAVWRWRRGWRGHPTGRWRPGLTAGVAALGVLWIAPVVELWRDHPNNAQLLWSFVTGAHAAPPLRDALQAVAEAATVLPFGTRDYVQVLHRNPAQLATGVALLLAVAILAVVLARRRHRPVSYLLVAAAAIGPAVATVSLATTAGPASLYLVMWLAYVPVSLLVALAVAVAPSAARHPVGDGTRRSPAGRGPGRHAVGRWPVAVGRWPVAVGRWPVAVGRWPALAACLVAVALAGVAASSAARAGSVAASAGAGPWPATAAGTQAGRLAAVRQAGNLAAAAVRAVRPGDRHATLTIGEPGLWPDAAAVVLALSERGVTTTVEPSSWDLYFGSGPPARLATVDFTLEPSTARRGGPVASRGNGPLTVIQVGDAVLGARHR